MTKEDQNQIIKDAWVRNLQKKEDIPEDIGQTFRNWVLGLIKKSNGQLTQMQGPQDKDQQQSEGQQQNQAQAPEQGQQEPEQEQEQTEQEAS